MKRITHKRTLLSLLVCNALALAGCKESDYAAISCNSEDQVAGQINCATTTTDDTTDDTGYTHKGGVTGRVFGEHYWVGATVCFDHNRNGLCDRDSEPTEKVYQQGQYSFTAASVAQSIKDKVPLLALSPSKQSALYAPSPALSTASDVNVSPFTTLVVNETTFNPLASGKAATAINLLSRGEINLGNETALQGQDYLAAEDQTLTTLATQLASTLANVQAQEPSKHYQATAATVDQWYQKRQYAVTVSKENIAAQTALGDSTEATLSDKALSWTTQHADEASVAIHAQNGLGVVGSKYHNRLVILDATADTTPRVLSLNNIATSSGDRYAIDARTGASEQSLTDVKLSSDKTSAFVAVKKYHKDSAAKGVGVYRANLSDTSNVPEVVFASETSNSANFYAFSGLNGIALSEDGSTLALAGEDKKITLLNAHDFSHRRTINVDSKVRSIALSPDGQHVYAGIFGSRIGLLTLNTQSGAEQGFLATSGTDYPFNIQSLDNKGQFAFYQRDGKNVFIYQITGSNFTLLKQISAANKVTDFDFSSNKQQLVLGVKGGRVELHDIEQQPRLLKALQTEAITVGGASKPVNGLSFVNDNQVLVSVKNGVHTLTITERSVTTWSDLQKQAWLDEHRKAR